VTAQKTPLSRTLTAYVDGMIRKEIQKLGKALPCQVVDIDPTGTIVTVSFQLSDAQLPQVKLPVAGAEYIRYPIQKGSLGVTFPADTYLGQVTGLGSGTASLTRRANLSTLVFFPVGNKNFTATDDADAVLIYGPNGVILRDTGKKTTVTLIPDGVDIHAQHNVTVEADTKVQATVGSNNVLLNTSEVQLTVGSNSVLINATEIVLTLGGATFTMTASGIVSTVPITAPTFDGNVSAPSNLVVAGKEMSGHKHDVVGVQTGGSTLATTAPV
jgi:hypothetical protein